MRVVITQSNYIPWRGSFDTIDRADLVVLYDDVQYTKRDWRNRNKIKTAGGTKWISVPVKVKGRYDQLINQVEISDSSWTRSHVDSIRQAYRGAPAFDTWGDRLVELYERAAKLSMLSDVNHLFLTEISEWLGIDTPFRWSTEFDVDGDATDRLIRLCDAVGADTYLTGPAARGYLDVDRFGEAGVTVEWLDYEGFPTYPQLHGDFEPAVSIVDVLLNCGDDAAAMALRHDR